MFGKKNISICCIAIFLLIATGCGTVSCKNKSANLGAENLIGVSASTTQCFDEISHATQMHAANMQTSQSAIPANTEESTTIPSTTQNSDNCVEMSTMNITTSVNTVDCSKREDMITDNFKAIDVKAVSNVSHPILTPYQITDFDKELVERVNDERRRAGLNTLVISSDICGIAAIRAEEASVSWSHTRPCGGSCDTLFNEYRIEWTLIGENLAHASSYDAELIVNSWMNSPSHKANIMNKSFNVCGIATYVSSNGDLYIAQIFSK